METQFSKVLICGLLALSGGMFTGGAMAAADNMSVRIYNRSSDDLVQLYVSPTYSRYIGNRDLLGSRVLPAGYNMRIDFDVPDAEGQCVLDLVGKTVAAGTWRKRMNVCTSSAWTLYD